MAWEKEKQFTTSIDLDIPEKGVDLAKLIYDVAQDCC